MSETTLEESSSTTEKPADNATAMTDESSQKDNTDSTPMETEKGTFQNLIKTRIIMSNIIN